KSITVKGPEGSKELPLSISRLDDRGDLRQRWATGRLRELLDQGVGRAALVDLGMRYGVVTPTTSLYVPTRAELESERVTIARQARYDDDEALQAAAELAAEENKEGGRGTRAKGEEGTMGSPNQPTSHRFAV